MLTLFNTNKCNLNCIYCSTDSGKRLLDELSLDEKKRLVREAHEMGAELIALCGSGEPMLDKDFYPLVEYINSLGLITEIVTNGTCINKKNAKWLYHHNSYIVFKLNSFNKKTTGALVGKKNAYKWVKYGNREIPYGLKCLIDTGFNKIPRKLFFCAPFQVECITSKYNYKDIPEVAAFCRDNNIYFFLETIIWDGRALKNRNMLELAPEHYKLLYKRLKNMTNLEFLIHQKRVGCVLEKNPVVGVTGDIRICYSRGCNIGNVKDRSLKNLYTEAQRLRKQQSIPFYKGILRNRFKTCAGRDYFLRKMIK